MSITTRRAAWAAVLLLGAAVGAAFVVLASVSGALGAASGVASALGSYAPSSRAVNDIPPAYLGLYEAAARKYSLDWAVLAAIGKVECDHGRDPDPSCTRHGSLNYAGAGGPAQFLLSTWRIYGVDGDGDGTVDMWDPADAIFGMANLLRHSGAPGDYSKAVFAYNHAGWYVAEVSAWARRYRGALSAPTPDQTLAWQILRVGYGGVWLAQIAGGLRCDARIVPDVQYLLARYDLSATACYAGSGHAAGGEHPLGLAVDLVPADGDWSRTLNVAEAFGWRPSCAASGCVGLLREPLRFVGYNGYPGHGDPVHAGANAHLHLSWQHGPAQALTPAPWVDVFAAATPGG